MVHRGGFRTQNRNCRQLRVVDQRMELRIAGTSRLRGQRQWQADIHLEHSRTGTALCGVQHWSRTDGSEE